MSRIGKSPIPFDNKVKVNYKNSVINVEGPKGKFSRKLHDFIEIKIENNQILVTCKDMESRESKSIYGLTRNLINNMVIGVGVGFTRGLEVIGIGYRVQMIGNNMVQVAVGHSHPILYVLPEGVTGKVEKTKVILESADKQMLGEACATLRSFRPPEPYNGKGIKYDTEVIKRKEGKKMVA